MLIWPKTFLRLKFTNDPTELLFPFEAGHPDATDLTRDFSLGNSDAMDILTLGLELGRQDVPGLKNTGVNFLASGRSRQDVEDPFPLVTAIESAVK